MKKFNGLSVFELASLSDQEFERYIKYALMEAGIVVQHKPLEPNLIGLPDIKPVGTVYKVRFKGTNAEVFFKDKDEAMSAMNMTSAVRLDSHYDDGVSYTLNEEESARYYSQPELSPVQYLNKAEHCSLEQAKKRNKELSKEHEKALEEWYSTNEGAEAIRSDMKTAFTDAVHRVLHFENILATREKYIDLSNGDERVAENFLGKAYSEEDIKEASSYAEWKQSLGK